MLVAGAGRRAALVPGAAALALLVMGLQVDAAGRLLAWPAAAVLSAAAVRDLLTAPALVASTAGLQVATGWRRRHVTWPEVQRLRVVTDRRAPLLELDLDDVVVLLSRRRLGRPPAEVLDLLLALRGGRS